MSNATGPTSPPLKHRCLDDYSWTCDDCGQVVQPVTVEVNDQEFYYTRNFCECPAGQAKKEAHEERASSEEKRAQAENLVMQAGLNSGRYGQFRFNTWDKTRHEGATVVDKISQYVDMVSETGNNWLYMYGGYGLGKTHLAIAAVRKIAATRLWKPHVVVWTDLCQQTKESWGKGYTGPTENQLWARARGAQILLIDDLDKTGTGEWAMGRLFGLINTRSVRLLPTIITANASLSDLRDEWTKSDKAHLSDTGLAVLSRIAENLWGGVKFTGQDQRWIRK